MREELVERPVVMLIGAGTSDYIGQTLELLIRQRWGCEVMTVASTDMLPNMAEYVVPGRRYLWISFSRSGDSPEGVAVLEQAIATVSGGGASCRDLQREGADGGDLQAVGAGLRGGAR